MTTQTTIGEIYARDSEKISKGAVLLIDPKKKVGHNRVDLTFNFIVSEVFESGGKIFVRGNHELSARSMVLDPGTRVIL